MIKDQSTNDELLLNLRTLESVYKKKVGLPSTARMYGEAADEIERLRAHLAAAEARSASNGDHARLANANQESIARALKASQAQLATATKALEKLRRYNLDIYAGRINHRSLDHIQVIDDALATITDGDKT